MSAAPGALAEVLSPWGDMIDRSLSRYLGRGSVPSRLRESMEYSVFSGGKRLRPLLVLMATDACLGSIESALPAACAVEFVHNYSLVHDDLPAMDNDDFRRGRPTCHRKFDEATAILAGDALLTLAFEAISEIEPAVIAIRCVKELAYASGQQGMVGGQVDDLFAAEGPGTLDWLESLHARKTGALLLASLRMGAMVANSSADRLAELTEFGKKLGLAFQITDDLLDVVGTQDAVGKGVNKDQQAGKLTYPGLLGVEESKRRARELIESAKQHLLSLGPASERLRSLADFVLERDR